jgi:copper(I)-binding protein
MFNSILQMQLSPHARPGLDLVLAEERSIRPGAAMVKTLVIILAGLMLAGMFATLGRAQGFKAGDIDIGHPHARAMVPGATVGGGYLKLTNNGAADDRLLSITCDRAKSSQIHQMSVSNGVMTMRAVGGGLAIPAGQTVELKPGGYHIMFVGVTEAFKEGETIKATLTFEKAGAVSVEFAVGSLGGTNAGAKDAHSDMGGMDMAKPQ